MSKVTDLTGQRFSSLIVESRAENKKGRCARWNCLCDCGKKKTIDASSLKRGFTKSCGCLSEVLRNKDIENVCGIRFGSLVVIDRAPREKKRVGLVKCQCDCGNEKVVELASLKSGRTKSCGCLAKKPRYTKHGLSHSSEYNTFKGMKGRCNNRKNNAWEYYGGRGIKVCERWSGEDGFTNFYKDMGPRPGKEYSIDRIDVDGDYSPENCRWANDKQQAANKRDTYYVEYNNQLIHLSEAARLEKRSQSYIRKHYPRVYP